MTQFRRVDGAEDDALLRALLRDNAMPGWVDMALCREPAFAAAAGRLGDEWGVLALEDEQPVGAYTAAVRPVWLDGAATRLGYLGGLRVVPAQRRRIRHLREGYASIRPLAPVACDRGWWTTVVAEGNRPARRLLEAGVAGLPRYRPMGRIVTLALPTARGRASAAPWRQPAAAELPALLAWQARQAARHQLAAVLDEALLQRIGMQGLRVLDGAQGPAALALLWDQSDFKQVVARRYAPALRRALPLVNAWARLARRVPLPCEGGALSQTFLAFLALGAALECDAGAAVPVIAGLLAQCRSAAASLCLHAAHPWLAALQRLAPLRYPAIVYAVEFDEPAVFDARPVQPEAAWL